MRVLAIDDEADILMVVEGVLRVNGHEAVTATDPERAVELALEHAVEVVVLDVNMPGRSGFETLQALRAEPRTAELPVLFLSALGDTEHKIRGLREGADDYLAKPFSGEELLLRLESLVGRAAAPDTGQRADRALFEEALAAADFQSQEVFLGRYRALEIIGRGGMGVVLRGFDPILQREVALKTMRLDNLGLNATTGEELGSRLAREATALARFNHPHIVAVHDAGASAGTAYLVMELIEGVSALHLIQERFLNLDESVEIARAVARALVVAHGHGLMHRDVNPANVLISFDGRIKVTDFGLAETVTDLAADGRIFGTPGFIPPECLMGERYTPAGDIFGLGAVVYRCLTESPAFRGRHFQEVLKASIATRPVPPRELRAEIPPELSDWILRMLSFDPADRPTAAQVLDFFEQRPTGGALWKLSELSSKPREIGPEDTGSLVETLS